MPIQSHGKVMGAKSPLAAELAEVEDAAVAVMEDALEAAVLACGSGVLVELARAENEIEPLVLGARAPCVTPKGSVVGGGVEIVAAATVMFAIERPVLVYTQRQVGS